MKTGLLSRDEEITEVRAAARADPRNAYALARLAERLFHDGETEIAATLAAEALTVAPDDFTVQYLGGAILGMAGEVGAALTAARRAVDLRPDSAEALHHLGALLLRAERPGAASQILLRLVEVNPNTASAWRLFAEALRGSGNTARAVEAMRKAIEFAPTETEYHLHLAGLLGALGRFGDAITVLDAAQQEFASDGCIHRMRSSFWAILDETALAIDDAAQAVALDPTNAEYRDHLSRLGVSVPSSQPKREQVAESEWLSPRFSAKEVREIRPVRWGEAFAAQGRILAAIILRETRTRFGHTKLGYFWAVFEPIAHLATIGVIFHILNHAPPPVGDHVFLFYISGLIPFLLFWNISQDLITSIASNTSLLQMPIVRPLDVALARSLLYFATLLMSGILVFSMAELLGSQGVPNDPLEVAAAVLTLWALATGVGLINVVISTFIKSWETFVAAVNRLLYFASGIYFSPIMIPGRFRDVLTLNPVMQGVEWFRMGFFRGYEPPWVDRVYLLIWALCAVFLGMALFRVFRKRLLEHR